MSNRKVALLENFLQSVEKIRMHLDAQESKAKYVLSKVSEHNDNDLEILREHQILFANLAELMSIREDTDEGSHLVIAKMYIDYRQAADEIFSHARAGHYDLNSVFKETSIEKIDDKAVAKIPKSVYRA